MHPRRYNLYVTVAILWGLLVIAACDSNRRAAMTAVLEEADSLNRNYILITSDSLLREAADYFNRHGTPNERPNLGARVSAPASNVGEDIRTF